MSIHFTGVSTLLRKTKEDLQKSLRKELKRLEGEGCKASHTNIEWAVGWRRKRDSFFNFEVKLRDRVEQFTARAAVLDLWAPQSDQLRATGILCEKVRATDPGPLKTLNQLVSDYRERFSVDAWSGLDAVSEFAKRLQSVQSEVQRLLFRHMQAFNRELETLRKEYPLLLPSTPPPTFDVPLDGDMEHIVLHEAFQQLYRWALTGFQAVIAECRQRKENGLVWRDFSSAHTRWKDIDRQVEKALQSVTGVAAFDDIRQAGAKVLSMLNGFTAGNGKSTDGGLQLIVYSDPLAPPDFEQLKNMFIRGEVLIRVEPRAVTAEINSFEQEKG